MAPEIVEDVMRAYAEETNRLNRERRSNGDAWKADLVKVEKQIAQIVEAIADGMYHPSMKEKMTGLEARREELTALLADAPADTPDLLPGILSAYEWKVSALTAALAQSDERPEAAAQALRSLIEKIVLFPGPQGRHQRDAAWGIGHDAELCRSAVLRRQPHKQKHSRRGPRGSVCIFGCGGWI